MAISAFVRPCLKSITAYSPGKSIASVQRELGLKRIIKLASNENPLGPSPKALKEFRRSAARLALYPEGTSPELRRAVADFHKIEEEQVIIGNGSDEIIRLLCEAYLDPGDEAVISQYAFIRFKQQVLLMSAKVVEIPMGNWAHDLEAMARKVGPKTKLLLVANPNNPTGNYNTEEEIKQLLKSVPSSCIVVLDEAYYHFARRDSGYPESVPRLVREFPNLVVLRTFSKAYGLAGLRIGYGVAAPEIISWLDRIRMPFNVNLPAQRAAIAALDDVDFVRKSVDLICDHRDELSQNMRALGFEVPGSAANFLFVRGAIPGRQLFESMLRLGVIIRPLGEYGLPDHARISIGTPEQNKVLMAALKKVLAPRKGSGVLV